MRRTTPLLLAILLSVLCGKVAVAQTIDDGALWLAYFDTEDLHDSAGQETPWRVWFDAHARFLEDADGFNQSILRPGLGRVIADDSALWAGYAWIRTSPVSGEDTDEHRLWQQWTWNPEGSGIFEGRQFAFRTRFEQRLIEGSDDTALRLRQFWRTSKAIAPGSRFTTVLWDEAFFHLNDADIGIEAGFNQNRVFAGMGYQPPAAGAPRIEAGYLNQTINLPGSVNRSNHILSINFFY